MEVRQSFKRDLPCDWNIQFYGRRACASSGLPLPCGERFWLLQFWWKGLHSSVLVCACTAVFWCVHAQPWPLASWRATDGGVEVRAPRGRLPFIGSTSGEWRKTTRSKSPGRARGGCCSFLQAPRLSDSLEGASGSDLYVGKRGGPKPSFL